MELRHRQQTHQADPGNAPLLLAEQPNVIVVDPTWVLARWRPVKLVAVPSCRPGPSIGSWGCGSAAGVWFSPSFVR